MYLSFLHLTCHVISRHYHAWQAGEEYGKFISLDLRPSDAINLAARAKVREAGGVRGRARAGFTPAGRPRGPASLTHDLSLLA